MGEGAAAAVVCRAASADEVARASALARRVFDRDVAPGYSDEGRAAYHRFADSASMAARAGTCRVYVALAGDEVVGMLEVREEAHVAMLFVDPAWQRRGVGRGLMEGAFGAPDAWPALTVNSAPGAVEVYERLGFAATATEREQDGIRFVPMRRLGGVAR